MFIATTTICDDDERDERVDDLERERERVLSRSECESERAFSFFLESLGVLSCAFFLFPTDLRSGFD